MALAMMILCGQKYNIQITIIKRCFGNRNQKNIYIDPFQFRWLIINIYFPIFISLPLPFSFSYTILKCHLLPFALFHIYNFFCFTFKKSRVLYTVYILIWKWCSTWILKQTNATEKTANESKNKKTASWT